MRQNRNKNEFDAGKAIWIRQNKLRFTQLYKNYYQQIKEKTFEIICNKSIEEMKALGGFTKIITSLIKSLPDQIEDWGMWGECDPIKECLLQEINKIREDVILLNKIY